MAQLLITVLLETTDEYDEAVLEDKRLRLRNIEQPTAADRMGHEVGRVIRGLGRVNGKSVSVQVARVESIGLRRDDDGVPTPINDTPSEKKRTG